MSTYEKTPGVRHYRNYTDVSNTLPAVNNCISKKLVAPTIQIEVFLSLSALENTSSVWVVQQPLQQEELLISKNLGIVADWDFRLSKHNVTMVIKK